MSGQIAMIAYVVAGPVFLGLGIWLLATSKPGDDKSYPIVSVVFGSILTLAVAVFFYKLYKEGRQLPMRGGEKTISVQ